MKYKLRTLYCLATGLGLLSSPAIWAASSSLEEIIIIGVRDDRTSTGATGLNLDIQHTPQSLSIISSDVMEKFSANNINDALDLAPGINVERWETNRTSYTSRGFEIKNTQIDGIGLPNNWGIVTGAVDTAGYEKIEVIRGANGLLTGLGNASGTINFIRKRPTNEAGGEVRASAGSWDFFRLEADYSTPITANGDWAARVVAASETANSYLDGKSDDRNFFYGVVDGQLTENSTLAVGASIQKTYTEGNMWGALSFSNSDGSQAEWDTDASTTQDWTYWDTETKTAFIEYTYFLPKDWQVKLSYNYRDSSEDDQLFFASSAAGLDPQDRTGLTGWPGKYSGNNDADLYEVRLSGGFDAFGNTHELILGASYSKGNEDLDYYPVDGTDPAFGDLPAFPYSRHAVAEPAWGNKTIQNRIDDELTRFFGATRFNFGRLKTIIGFNAVDFERDALTQVEPIKADKVSPYAGVTYDVTDDITFYASYSDIYEPQDKFGLDEQYLDPTEGRNYEAGVKANWMDSRLMTSVAVFKAKQLGIGVYAGFNPNTANYWYTGEDVYSEGIEFEVSGQLNEYANITFGATFIDMEDENHDTTYEWIAEQQLSLTVSTVVPQYEKLSLGLNSTWQSDTERADGYTGYDVKQGSYLLANAYARWNLTDNSYVQLNINNLTDKKYINSLYEIGYYGAPRNATASYTYKF